jgi:hypothetical protein
MIGGLVWTSALSSIVRFRRHPMVFAGPLEDKTGERFAIAGVLPVHPSRLFHALGRGSGSDCDRADLDHVAGGREPG